MLKLTALHAFNGLADAEREWAIMKCLEIAKRHGCSSYVSQVKVRQNSSKAKGTDAGPPQLKNPG